MQYFTVRKITKRTLVLRWVLIGGLIIMLAAAWLSYDPLKRRYKTWKQQRALAQARDFMAQQDFPRAKLALDVALTAVPGATHALQVAADLLEQVGSPEVMVLRRRLVQLQPDSLEPRVALIDSALRFRDINAARDAIRELPDAQRDRPEALKAMLAYAMATDNRPIADALYDRLKQLEPDNDRLKVMHALLRLKNSKPATLAAAREELEGYLKDPRHALFIRREMMLAAMQRNDRDDARRLAALIAADPQATLADRLHDANFALNVDKRPFAEVFANLAPHAAGQPADAAELVRWTVLVGQHERGAAWLETLPPAVRDDAALLPVRAEVASARGDWDRMADLLEAGAWGPVDRDAIRLAFSARLAADRNNPTLQRQIWDEALTAAGRSQAGLTLLYRLSGIWRWEEPGERALWAMVRNFPLQAWAHQTLFNVYRQRGDIDNMQALIGALRERDGSMLRYRHDWALLSVLRSRSLSWNPAKQVMHELYQSDPENPHYVTGYAFALAQSDKAPEALEVLASLSEAEVAEPARAPYLAYIYGMARRQAEFERLAAAERDLTGLLREERELFTLGREALVRPVNQRIESALEKAAAQRAEAEADAK